MNYLKTLITLISLLSFTVTVVGQNVWTVKNQDQFTLNEQVLNKKLKPILSKEKKTVRIPFPSINNKVVLFEIEDASILPPALAKKFPSVHSFKGYSLKNKNLELRLTCIPTGIVVTLINNTEIWTVSSKNNTSVYELSQSKTKEEIKNRSSFKCGTHDSASVNAKKSIAKKKELSSKSAKSLVGDNKLKVLKTAITTTGEYSNFFINNANLQSGSVAQKKAVILGAISTSVNRINVALERDLGVKLELISNNDILIYLDPNTDPYTQTNDLTITIEEGNNTIFNAIGNNNFDLGHTLTTKGSGGLAQVGALCSPFKAEGVTGFSKPEGTFFDFTLFAHEIGHQLGGNHTQNANCQREFTSVEVGSGTTIMGYSGACGSDNILNESDPFFHSLSIEQIKNEFEFLNDISCNFQIVTLNNNLPIINTLPNYTIPVGVPFFLTTTVTDLDGDNLSYSWEQLDLEIGPSPPTKTASQGPQFRVFPPKNTPRRDFPNNGVDSKWEVLPSVPRIMNFGLLVRDGKQGGVAISNTTQVETIINPQGVFEITSQNTEGIEYNQNQEIEITWNVAGTQNAPFNTQNVSIELSYDGGITFTETLASSTPNTGKAIVVIPEKGATSQARIRINAIDNIFFTLSTTNFSISNVPKITISNAQDKEKELLVFRIKKSFPSSQPILVNFNFFNSKGADDSENIENPIDFASLSPILHSVDGNESTLSELTSNSVILPGNSTENFIMIPLKSFNQSVGLEKIKLVLNIPEGSENKTANSIGTQTQLFLNLEQNAMFFPIPTKDILKLELAFIPKDPYKIIVFDFRGTIVFETILRTEEEAFNLGHLASGLYLIQINMNDEIATRKIIIE